jgi:2-polyprenyl-6-methoxyphenol hydroxylase-like FAD-dependent oxidoreductase
VPINLTTPILIAGGGPIGLALAAALGWRGIDALLVEQNEDRVGSGKMLEVSMRTMEFCRQLGIRDTVRNWGYPLDQPLDSAFLTSLRGYEIGRVVTPSLQAVPDSAVSPERTLPCPQTWFDPILQRHARSFPGIALRYCTKLESFVQGADGVEATLRDMRSGTTETARAQYLVGADGFDSTVRDMLGIEVRGERHIDWSMTVYLRMPGLAAHHDKAPAFRYVFVGPEGTWSFLSFVDGKDLWRLQCVGLDPDKLQEMDIPALVRRAVGGEVPFSLENKNLWVRKRTVADRFSDGRVFLAGDAAHAHPPNGGLGMNTGIQDAFDLAWKFHAVLSGWGGPALLESYDWERRPASARAAETSLANYHRLTGNTRHPALLDATAEGEEARRTVGARLVEQNEKAWHPLGVHLGYIYHPSPIVIPDGTERPEDDTVGYRPTAFPGARAPHAWLAPGKSTLDLFGRGFVLLDFAGRPVDALIAAAERRHVPLSRHRIENAEIAALYGAALVLVRPDGHVAWRGAALPEDALALIDTVRGAGARIAARRHAS